MKTFYLKGNILLLATILLSCNSIETVKLADQNAAESVRMLYDRISRATEKGVIIGHQDATAYGIGWKYEEGLTSCDIEKVCGDYPGLYGWDLGHIENDSEFNLDTVYLNLTKKLIADAHRRGGISTISWHADNPVTGESAWSQGETVRIILTDEKTKEKFIGWLGKVATFLNSLKDEEGNPVPVIFRPWHEWTGSWFWWGVPQTRGEDFKDFWKLTVETLRDKYNVHNVLYAFSTGTIRNKDEMLAGYPGNEYVDIIGFDTYVYNDNLEEYTTAVSRNIEMFREIAKTGSKLFAITETGYESIPDSSWYSATVYPLIKNSGAAYVLFWRNANTKHHYAPYPGDVSAQDFTKFYNFPETIFEKEMAEIK